MTQELDLFGEQPAESPFDAIKHDERDGREWWSARELMPLLGYDKWERFSGAIDRARQVLVNQGVDPDGQASRIDPVELEARELAEADKTEAKEVADSNAVVSELERELQEQDKSERP